MHYVIAVKKKRLSFHRVVATHVGIKNLNNMDLQEKSFTELQALFKVAFLDWQENNLQIDRVKKRECENFAQFAKNRADLRRLSRENADLHNRLVRIDLEMQIRVWTGKND